MGREGAQAEPGAQERSGEERLDSWKEIAAYLRHGVSTVQRWEREERLPVHRHLHGKLGSVYGYKAEIDEWWRERSSRLESQDQGPGRGRGPLARRGLLAALTVTLTLGVVLAVGLARARFSAERRAPARRVMLAVLPFQDLSGNPQQDYFSDGLTEETITSLAQLQPNRLGVIARTSVMHYKGTSKAVEQIGKELGVDYLLEGSVRRSGSRVRVSAQLIDVTTGSHLWAERYDRLAADIFAVQDDLSRNIAAALKVALRPAAKPSPPTTNLEAYDAYLRGLYLAGRGDRKNTEVAIASFERAVALDPNFALAHAFLADNYRLMFFQYEAGKEWEEKAHVALQKALALDPDLPEAYVVRGRLTWTFENGFPHESAIQDFRRALAGNPSLVQAHRQLCSVYLHVGLLEEAQAECEAARQIDPTWLGVAGSTAQALLYQHKYEDVLALHQKYPQLPVQSRAFSRAPALIALGRDREARELVEAGLQKEPQNSLLYGLLALLLARAGEHAKAEEMIGRAGELGKGLGTFHHTEYFIACAYAAMGRKREALTWFERTVSDGFPCYPYFEKDPALDSLRNDPGFQAAMKRLNAQWEHYRTLV